MRERESKGPLMKGIQTLKDMFNQLVLVYYDLFTVITFNILYGVMIIYNDIMIWERYIFPPVVAPYLIPIVIGSIFIVSGLLVLIGKRFASNFIMSLGLSMSVFLWMIYGATFVFAIPPSGISLFSFYMVGLCIKIAIRQ